MSSCGFGLCAKADSREILNVAEGEDFMCPECGKPLSKADIERGVASSGNLVSGELPGVPIMIQPVDDKKVSIAAAPAPENQFKRLVLRVEGKGRKRITIR